MNLEAFVWRVNPIAISGAMGVWRSASIKHGVQYVMNTLTTLMQVLSAASWDSLLMVNISCNGELLMHKFIKFKFNNIFSGYFSYVRRHDISQVCV